MYAEKQVVNRPELSTCSERSFSSSSSSGACTASTFSEYASCGSPPASDHPLSNHFFNDDFKPYTNKGQNSDLESQKRPTSDHRFDYESSASVCDKKHKVTHHENEEEEDVEVDDDYVDTLDDDNPYNYCFDQTFDYTVDDGHSCSRDAFCRKWNTQTQNNNDNDSSSSVEITLPLKTTDETIKNSNLPKETVRLVIKRKPQPDIGRYDKICTLGVGTFGRVTLVRLKATMQYYALKTMHIKTVVENDQEDHVYSERRILEMIDHPFITRLYWAYKDNKFLYMLFDYMPGGELFSYLRSEGNFPHETARFYAAEILLALEYLHSKCIVYRDLKPENLLLNAQGNVVLIDFGFAKVLHDRTWTVCGTAEYLAPEIIECKGHNKAVDFWAFGILIFEMLVGRPPFRAETPYLTYQKILNCKLKFPRRFYANAKDLIKKLLVVDRTKRLGNMKGSAQDVKSHSWFRNVTWDDLYNRTIKPPIVPRINYEGDSGNYDEYDDDDDVMEDAESADDCELEKFENW